MDKCGNFVFNEPYIGNEIKQINNVVLPKQYLEFMKKHNGGQGDIGETWLEFFTLEDLQEINDDYCIEDFLPDHIIIGSMVMENFMELTVMEFILMFRL